MSNPASSLFDLIKRPTYALTSLAFAFLFFDLQFYVMARLPGYENNACVMGAGLNLENMIFAVIVSLMVGVLIVGLYETVRMKNTSWKGMTLTGIGAFFGGMTVFCTACTLPVLFLFGWGIGLSFFTFYNIWFKVLSVVLLLIGLHQINQQLKGICARCIE